MNTIQKDIERLLENDVVRIALTFGGAIGLYLGIVVGGYATYQLVVTIGSRI